MNLRLLRRQFGVVLQEPFLFAGSIRQNVAFNDPMLSLQQVTEAGTLAGIHDTITQMPMGYETLVAEGGSGLSGGQRQCLAIARAVAHRPAVLLLDEATSHLDVVTERLVDSNLSRLPCTRIVIAHRLSTIRNADLILVLDGGMIVERGSHEELRSKGGYYAALINTQLQNGRAADGAMSRPSSDEEPRATRGNDEMRAAATVRISRPHLGSRSPCSRCGHELRSRFCTMCGAEAGAPSTDHAGRGHGRAACERCGNHLRGRFCTSCGAPRAESQGLQDAGESPPRPVAG